jgi:hypothetical protein
VAGDVRVTGKITIGEWTLETRVDNLFGPKSSLYVTYQGTEVARFGIKQDMLQVFKINDNGQRIGKGYFYVNKDGGTGWGG